MLDLNFVRENIDTVRAALANRNFPTDALNEFAALDAERRRVIGESDGINQLRNASSKEIGALMQAGERDAAEAKKAEVAGLKEKQTELEAKRDAAESAMREILINLPNIPAADVPVGADESANIEVRKWGEPRTFAFEPKDHVDLGEGLGILDLERATKIAGSRFAILHGAGARLERALVNFMLDVHTTEHGYTETLPPYLVNRNSLFGTNQLPKFEEDLFTPRMNGSSHSYRRLRFRSRIITRVRYSTPLTCRCISRPTPCAFAAKPAVTGAIPEG
jgi:seryl-tRNA synthetase